MFQGPFYFHAMRVPLPTKAIYKRLGFKKGVTELNRAEEDKLVAIIDEASRSVHLKGAACMLDIVRVDRSGVELEDRTVFTSSALAGMLSGCDQVLLMGATAGQAIMEEISSATQSENLTRAVILDAVASEMTDSGLDWIVDYMNQDLMRKSRRLTKARFSAGYGDFFLENQKTVHALLHLDKIGVSITDRCILMPEKSVTAVAGIVAPR
jgi:cobalamin-dependent methionine synthase I